MKLSFLGVIRLKFINLVLNYSSIYQSECIKKKKIIFLIPLIIYLFIRKTSDR